MLVLSRRSLTRQHSKVYWIAAEASILVLWLFSMIFTLRVSIWLLATPCRISSNTTLHSRSVFRLISSLSSHLLQMQPVMVCQGRPLGDSYEETNTGPGIPTSPTGTQRTPPGPNTRSDTVTVTTHTSSTTTNSEKASGASAFKPQALPVLISLAGLFIGARLL